MNYIPLEQLKNAWVFRHKSLPIEAKDLPKIKPMSNQRANVLWDSYISRQVDHPDFFKSGDWAFNKSTWVENGEWEKIWDSEEPNLPDLISEHINWDNNTVIYFCCSRQSIIETTWQVFKKYWKNFLFMDDGSLLVGKKRNETVQFLSTGRFKLGQRPL